MSQQYNKIERIRRKHELAFFRSLYPLFARDMRKLKAAIRDNPAAAMGLIDTLFDYYEILAIVRQNLEKIGTDEATRVYNDIIDRAERKASAVGFLSQIINAIIRNIAGNPFVADRIRNVSENMKQTVRDKLQEGMRNNLSARSLAALFTAEFSRMRALRIVRTETTAIFNEASLEGAKATGYPVLKKWLAGTDARTRDSHLEMNAKDAIPIDNLFDVGGKRMARPGDGAGGAKEVVNCRCVMIYEVQ